jgi:oligopeptide/dipeptide ABC transporter ATP-binding protein
VSDILVRTKKLSKFFFQRYRPSFFALRPVHVTVRAVLNCSLEIQRGETFCLVGESGSGKTTLARIIADLYRPTEGQTFFDGRELTALPAEAMKEYRKKIQMVFQDPSASLNPRQTIENIVSLPIKIHCSLNRVERRNRVMELLKMVQLPPEIMRRYPHSLSGGQKQRVAIARALSVQPKLVILDEPTSALDVSVQAKVLDLLSSVQQRLNLTYLMITHNLSLVRNLADHIAVMYLGQIVEHATCEAIFESPCHPYTKALLSAIPVVTEAERRLVPEEVTLEGEIPSPSAELQHCAFLSRCQERAGQCSKKLVPRTVEVKPGHFVVCHLFSR